MSIHTNRLKIEFNIEAIERDFAFIRFEREQKKWNGAPQLDQLLGNEYQATAVMYQYGKYAYAMFRRPVDTYKLISRIRDDDGFADDAVIEALPRAIRTDVNVCICEAWLAQILLNSLSSSQSRFKQFHFCNLTGALLFVPDLKGKMTDVIDATKVKIDSNYLMNAEIVRHRKLISAKAEIKAGKRKAGSIQNKPMYVLHEGTSTLRRWLPRDGTPDAKRTYIKAGIEGKRASVPFLDFRSSKHYEQSRAGVLHHVLNSIQKNLSDYISVTPSPIETPHTVELNETILKTPKQLRERFDEQPVQIVDRVGSEESSDLIKSLKEGILPYLTDNKLLTVGKHDKPESLNFRIIHDADYYAESGEDDEYLPSTPSVYRQHITIENAGASFDTSAKPVVKTIIKEMLIKKDIGERNLSLFDWSKLNTKHAWTFAISDERAKRIIFMEIQPDGRFEFRELDGNNLFGHGEYQEYVELITDARKNEWRTNVVLDGLVISEEGDKNLIFRTNEITIPDLDNIKKTIDEVDAKLPSEMQTGSVLASIVEQCFADTPNAGKGSVCMLTERLNDIGVQELSKKEFKVLLKECLGSNTKLANQLRGYLSDEHGIKLIFSKKKENLNTHFDASLNINYFGETESEAYYFVGERYQSVQFSFNNACHLRKIAAVDESNLIFKDLLPTMNVDFVKTGQSTVVPFPFKYLREYMEFDG